jgi:hypothetical protein
MNGVNIGRISCKDCEKDQPWSFLEKHTLLNFGGMRSFNIPVTYYAMGDGKQHCVVRCDECTKTKGVSTPAPACSKHIGCTRPQLLKARQVIAAANGNGSE